MDAQIIDRFSRPWDGWAAVKWSLSSIIGLNAHAQDFADLKLIFTMLIASGWVPVGS